MHPFRYWHRKCGYQQYSRVLPHPTSKQPKEGHLHAGVFTAWVLAGPRLYSVPVKVPRTVYINSAAPASDARCQGLGAPTTRMLPHGHQALHLFKVEPHACASVPCATWIMVVVGW